MENEVRIRRLELAVAALAEMLVDMNPHIEEELREMAVVMGEDVGKTERD